MGIVFVLSKSLIISLSCLFVVCLHQLDAQPNVFNLKKYGGVGSKSFDNSKALLRAWNDACKLEGQGEARLVIPSGTYLVNPVQLVGPCKTPIKIINNGKLLSPSGQTNLNYWISFRYLKGLTIYGGLYDGQGETIWSRSHLINPGYAMLSLAFVDNANIRNVNLQNSKKTHIHIFGCNDLQILHSSISSPDESPNTDGIKMGVSNDIRIADTNIASGDDCIAILKGTKNLNVTRVRCGPGHGISIGSMGGSPGDDVRQISVRNCTFTKTTNGVRIKSWASGHPGVCSDISFRDIIMEDVFNPIIIDQNYCPRGNCVKGNSGVQIQGVKFENIKGTSASNVGINLQCSQSHPCKNVRLHDIDLKYNARGGGRSTSLCHNVRGRVTRVTNPGSCLVVKS